MKRSYGHAESFFKGISFLRYIELIDMFAWDRGSERATNLKSGKIAESSNCTGASVGLVAKSVAF